MYFTLIIFIAAFSSSWYVNQLQYVVVYKVYETLYVLDHMFQVCNKKQVKIT